MPQPASVAAVPASPGEPDARIVVSLNTLDVSTAFADYSADKLGACTAVTIQARSLSLRATLPSSASASASVFDHSQNSTLAMSSSANDSKQDANLSDSQSSSPLNRTQIACGAGWLAVHSAPQQPQPLLVWSKLRLIPGSTSWTAFNRIPNSLLLQALDNTLCRMLRCLLTS